MRYEPVLNLLWSRRWVHKPRPIGRTCRRGRWPEALETRRLLSAENTWYVQQLYQDLLGRPADSSGLQFFAGQLDAGATRGNIAAALTHTAEYEQVEIAAAYQAYLHRAADPQGLSYLESQLAGGVSLAQVRAELTGSTEYAGLHGLGSDAFLKALFVDVLGRSIDPAAEAAFLADIAAGESYGNVALTVVTSAEAGQHDVENLYSQLLHRAADAAGLAYWGPTVQQQGNDASVVSGIVSSDEYFGLATRDVLPPVVALASAASGSTLSANAVINGTVTDDRSGVKSLTAQVDGGAAVAVPFDASGNFQFTTSLAVDGSDDGPHVVSFTATDNAGNVSSGTPFSFTLNTLPSNVAAAAGPGVQQNPSVAVDPSDPNHVVMAYMDYTLVKTGYAGIGIAVSHDAGATWQYTSLALPTGFDQGAADPTVRFDASGQVYVSYMAATFLGPQPGITDPSIVSPTAGVRERALGMQANNGVFVDQSGDGGMTWDPPVAIVSHTYDGTHQVPFEIKPEIAVDTFATLPNGQPNPRFGEMYAVWSRYYPVGQFPDQPTATGGSDIMFAVSSDQGKTWQLQLEPDPNAPTGTGTMVTVLEPPSAGGNGNNGDVAVGTGLENWSHVTIGPEGDIYVSNFRSAWFEVHHSTDGGKTFVTGGMSTADAVEFPANGGQQAQASQNLPNDQFRTQNVRAIVADPTRPGTVYVAESVYVSDVNGNPLDPGEIVFARSTDYGATWTTSFTVDGVQTQILNDDNGGHTASGQTDDVVDGQALPRIAIDDHGNLAVIWYDTRRDPANTSLDVFGTISTDGGKTFSPNFRLTDQTFDPNQGKFTDAEGQTDYYLGDFLGMAMANNTIYAAWTDTRNGNQDIYFQRRPLSLAVPANLDRYEPNNTAATATDLGRVVSSHQPKLTIPAGDEDWFRVTAAASGPLTVSALANTGVGLQVQLWDSSGKTLLAKGTDQHDAQGNFLGQNISYAASSGVTYLVRILPGSAATATGPAGYTLNLQSLTADLGTSAAGTADGTLKTGDQAYYALTAPAEGSLQVSLTPGANAQGAFTLELLDAQTLAVLATAQASSGGGGSLNANLDVQSGQKLLLHVMGDATTQGSFQLLYVNLDQFSTANLKSLFFPAGAQPSEAVIADFNGDGIPDIAVSDVGTNSVSVLLGNGDGTFQAPRQYEVGAFQVGEGDTLSGVPAFHRELVAADVNGDGIPDLVVANHDSADISVLIGRGDGTFEPQRRYDATGAPFALAAGDLTGNGKIDLAVLDSTPNPNPATAAPQPGTGAILLGRGDGSFQLPQPLAIPAEQSFPTNSLRIADFNHDGKADVLMSEFNAGSVLFLGNGDGTFQPGKPITIGYGPGIAVGDLNGDGNLDIALTNYGTNDVVYVLGNGDGTFQPEQKVFGGQTPVAVAIADLGSEVTLPDGTTTLGPPDGHPDLVVADNGLQNALSNGPAEIVVLPAELDANGNFTGFGAPIPLASATAPLDVKTADLTNSGHQDIVAVDGGGVRVIYTTPPPIKSNDTPQTARNLGTVVHLVEPTLTIVPGHEDRYYTLTVPTEAAQGAGDEIVDFSGAFTALAGAGLTMDVTDANGDLLGSGERFRVLAQQGETLTLHVTAATAADGTRGSGAYTLDIDVLPQLVGVEAQSLLPGTNGQPGGPTTSLVLTFQGDRLDPTAAQNPANYTVTWLGPDGLAGTADDQVIAIDGGTSDSPAVVYDPSANVDVATGTTYPTAVQQTVTLQFAHPLPAGSYLIRVSPNVQAALFNQDEPALLAGVASFAQHPVVSLNQGSVANGALVAAIDLVHATGALGDLTALGAGTPFLQQLHDDLSTLLDSALTSQGTSADVTPELIDQVLSRFNPALGAPGSRPTGLLVLWLDTVSYDVEDPDGGQTEYNVNTGQLSTPQTTYVNVTGNVEVVVVPIAPTNAGTYTLNVGNVTSTARGGVVVLGANGSNQTQSLTTPMQQGTTQFTIPTT